MSAGDPLIDLALIGVVDAGVPNLERVVLRPMQDVNLSDFGVTVGLPAGHSAAYPLFDNAFWFPALTLSPPAWVLLYTGIGSPRETVTERGERVVTLFWNRRFTVFNAGRVVPILFRLGGVVVGPPSRTPNKLASG